MNFMICVSQSLQYVFPNIAHKMRRVSSYHVLTTTRYERAKQSDMLTRSPDQLVRIFEVTLINTLTTCCVARMIYVSDTEVLSLQHDLWSSVCHHFLNQPKQVLPSFSRITACVSLSNNTFSADWNRRIDTASLAYSNPWKRSDNKLRIHWEIRSRLMKLQKK